VQIEHWRSTEQKFQCAFCAENRNLVVEHDHEPKQGKVIKYAALLAANNHKSWKSSLAASKRVMTEAKLKA
jgi:hypothetical protein